MTESTANQALNSYYENQVAEKQRWASKLAPAKPRAVKTKQEKKSIFQRFFGV